MRVLITGAGSPLGTALAPLLAEAGFTPRLFDVRPLKSQYEFVEGNVRLPQDVQKAVEDVDLIVHNAALHGTERHDDDPREIYELNVTGTFNIYLAATWHHVRGVVLNSTVAVYGQSGRPADDNSVVALREGVLRLPDGLFGFSKEAGEEMGGYFQRRHDVATIALRYGLYAPDTFFRSGIRLLYGGVDIADMARAALAAVVSLADGGARWEACNVTSLVPFMETDGPGLRHDPLLMLDKYYPGAPELLQERGVTRLQPIERFYPMEWAADQLKFQPRYNFEQWLEELRARPAERAEQDPPWP
jgi:nucleoside-diphosphate-sugar epimerase